MILCNFVFCQTPHLNLGLPTTILITAPKTFYYDKHPKKIRSKKIMFLFCHSGIFKMQGQFKSLNSDTGEMKSTVRFKENKHDGFQYIIGIQGIE